jgi:Domain of unknown function (DUF4112)
MSESKGYQEPIEKAREFARVMDRLVGLPGSEIGVGLDAVVGALVPVGGDVVGGFASLYVVWQALRAKVPAIVIARMLLNIGLDALIGLIPIVGDIADVFFQANRMNLKLLEKHAGGGQSTRADWLVVSLTMGFALVAIASPVVAMFAVGQLLLHR